MVHQEQKIIRPGAKTAVLFVHGILGSPRQFRELVKLVPEEMSLWNLLLEGHGGGTRDFSRSSMKKWEAQVEAALGELCRSHQAVFIVGHSMGTLFAIEQAVKNEKVGELFLLACPIKLCLRPVMAKYGLQMYCGVKPAEGSPLADFYSRGGVALSKNPFAYLGWLPRFWELLGKIRQTRLLLPELKTPCRAFQSGKDELVSRKAPDYLREHAAMEVTVLPRSGHCSYPPEELAVLTGAFTERIESEFYRG